MLQLEQIVSKNIQHHHLLDIEKPIVVAISGGADSIALLYILYSLGYNCIAAHCNFHLRGEESNRDEKHVSNVIKRLGIVGEFTHVNVDAYTKEGIEIKNKSTNDSNVQTAQTATKSAPSKKSALAGLI